MNFDMKDDRVLIFVVMFIAFFLTFLSVPSMFPGSLSKPITLEGYANGKIPTTDSPIIITAPKLESDTIYESRPFIDPKTGSIVDGPGFEVGPAPSGSLDNERKIPPNYYFLDDGSNGELMAHNMMCSKSCCSEQWPTPHKLKHDPYVCGNKDEFVPSKIFCNNGFQDSGCLCLPKKAARHIYNRGGNGREWF